MEKLAESREDKNYGFIDMKKNDTNQEIPGRGKWPSPWDVIGSVKKRTEI